MLQITAKHKVFLGVQAIDFRCGMDGISAICRRQFDLNPLSGHFFIFCNRRQTAIKILAYDSQGFWLMHKRMSKGKFKYWPKNKSEVLMLNATQLQVLLQNSDPGLVETNNEWHPIDR